MEDYEPVDVSKVKPTKVKSEKDLEKEMTEIAKTLKDTTSADWKDRVKSMESIQSIVNSEKCTGMANFPKLIDKLVRPLVAQLMDLRSAVTKEASTTLRIVVQSL